MNKNVYIKNLEAVDIYKNNKEGKVIFAKYTGMVAYSLELIKLQSIGFKVFQGRTGKNKSNDIINVKFGCGYKDENGKMVLNREKLREELYVNGFTLDGEKYVMYKRSGAKSRIGNCLFIKESLFKIMINWSHMYMVLPEDKPLDVVGLGAYSSLVTSAIEDTITINPDNILIIDDVESKFNIMASKVSAGADGYLESKKEMTEITSCFTDGSALLDSSLFTGIHAGKGMMLLRNHFFKSASFNTNIQKFFKDHFGSNYDTATVTDMFGNIILAKDIKMICTPNSLKAFKFSDIIGSEKDMFDYWKSVVRADNCIFGVVKHEKTSKHIFNGKLHQQMSYQMINSLPISKDELKDLTEFELDYVDKLKNDLNEFLFFLNKEKNDMNPNQMMLDLCYKNKYFHQAALFKDFRKKTISNYIKRLKKGKVKVTGDYCVMVSNPIEYLLASINEYDENNLILNDNQVYTSLFKDGEDLVLFRNPHTSQANVYLAHNTYNPLFQKYFNYTDNIIIVNCIKNEICDILSGCDWDSDTALVTNNSTLVKCASRCYRKYNVCVNSIYDDKKSYELSNKDMAKIDNELAKSKNVIGTIVNNGQLAMSQYWDCILKGNTSDAEELLKIIDVMTILSGVAIDNAKKQYDLKMQEEIKHIQKNPAMPELKPLFWKYVSQDKGIEDKGKLIKFNTPMDILADVLDENIIPAKRTSTVALENLLVPMDKNKANRKQIAKVVEEITEMQEKIGAIQAKIAVTPKDARESMYNEIEDIFLEEQQRLKVKKLKPETVYAILMLIAGDGQAKKVETTQRVKTKIINLIYNTHKEILLNAFRAE